MEKNWTLFVVSVLLLAGIAPATADDSAASKSAGGIALMHEACISMENEKLTIAPLSRPHEPNTCYRVTVDYEFVNHSAQDITTIVGFPVPPYDTGENLSAAGMRNFDDFRLWVDAKPTRYRVEARAFLKGKDVTSLVRSYGLDVPSLGHLDIMHTDNPRGSSPQIAGLPPLARKRLGDLELADIEDNIPLWQVHKTYYWTQTFPAHAVVFSRHQYTAAEGFELIDGALFTPTGRAKALADYKRENATAPNDFSFNDPPGEIQNLEQSCVDPSLQNKLVEVAKRQGGYVSAMWVDFILTTANNWQMPIQNFELDLEKRPGADSFVSVCWNGPIEHIDATHLRMRAKDFIPTRELHVLFLQ